MSKISSYGRKYQHTQEISHGIHVHDQWWSNIQVKAPTPLSTQSSVQNAGAYARETMVITMLSSIIITYSFCFIAQVGEC